MPSRFNIVRTSIYGKSVLVVFLCLAIAAHFQSLLVIDDLARFVPHPIFVSMLILLILLLGTFWLGTPSSSCVSKILRPIKTLGAFLASSSSENADTYSFWMVSTDGIYHAQYRALEAFSLFNVILIWAFLLFLLAMAVKHHTANVWFITVTSYPYFGSDANASKLPTPVVGCSRSRGRSRTKEDPELWRKASAYTVDRYMRNASPRR
ncbi:hypothetical protein SCLCIDRAFT_14029 [Scleroderma citrinum Foug A]|uniref:Uncharacterized protein n=1 Tax=Scleroderma citrinum Foug A TaxID=1036808 RepID=A0A0C3ASR9_9AGAM|nr:hypothetical protein SCLCIDRAFT_14029 [Scleroderma citrinum Foug A]